MPENQNSMDKALIALSQKKAAQAEQEKQLNKKPVQTGMDIMNAKPAVTNPDLKDVAKKPVIDSSIRNMVEPAINASPLTQNQLTQNTSNNTQTREPVNQVTQSQPVAQPRPVVTQPVNQRQYTKAEEIIDIPDNNIKSHDINHDELAKIADDALNNKNIKRSVVSNKPTGRPVSESTKSLQNASRVSEDFALSFYDADKKSTIKDFPKAMLYFIELELKSVGLHDIKQTDMVVGWLASKLDAVTLKKMAIALTDTQLRIVKALHHNALNSDTEKLNNIERQLQNLDKKMDSIRLLDAYTFMDRAGWIRNNATSPNRIEFDYSGPIGGIADIIKKADDSVLKLRMDLQRKTGRAIE